MFYDYCIYTIVHSKKLDNLLLTSHEGSFEEKNKWKEAKKMLENAKLKNMDLLVIFAPAETTKYLHSWAIITEIKISKNDKQTEYYFKNLTKLRSNNVLKTELKLKNSGKHMDENFIRPYALCSTPFDIIEYYSIDSNEYKKAFDNNLDNGINNIKDLINKFNEEMENSTPEKQKTIENKYLRKDSKFVNLLKEFHNYKCQFPDCNAKIITKNGPDYVEVAHIKPVSECGKTVVGNLLVLCPNHHKEFDKGNLEIISKDNIHIEGKLNGKYFNINIGIK
jgi:hypothetical protein